MKVNFDQIGSNLLLLIFMAFVIEAVISAIFSLRVVEELLRSNWLQTVRSAFVILVAFGLCGRIDEMRLFLKSGLKVPGAIDYVVTSLFLVRLTTLLHDFFAYLRKRSLES
ncbi:MAG: hypothetical protein NZM25_07065 [Leptospiraceae bacterium]|nr:hypothetical protein [Leptospiraceae bacterium]MDW8307079.1 hypothetical protein [Leptospiraceae bacterium]